MIFQKVLEIKKIIFGVALILLQIRTPVTNTGPTQQRTSHQPLPFGILKKKFHYRFVRNLYEFV